MWINEKVYFFANSLLLDLPCSNNSDFMVEVQTLHITLRHFEVNIVRLNGKGSSIVLKPLTISRIKYYGEFSGNKM